MTKKIVIIGAARSGTKLLRDVLSDATGAGAVPYDINFVWRYGNESLSHDLLAPSAANSKVRGYIPKYLNKYARGPEDAVIEKTVGNSLRVPFVRQVLPDAQFVHIIRDGVDVAESTRRQWLAAPDRRYLIAKARHFPMRMLPTYGRKYSVSLFARYFSEESRVASWGPRYPGMDQDLKSEDLLTVCARQWRASVESALQGFSEQGVAPVEVRYEEFVRDPVVCLQRLNDALGLNGSKGRIVAASRRVEPTYIGTGVTTLNGADLRKLNEELGRLLDSLGYVSPMKRVAQ